MPWSRTKEKRKIDWYLRPAFYLPTSFWELGPMAFARSCTSDGSSEKKRNPKTGGGLSCPAIKASLILAAATLVSQIGLLSVSFFYFHCQTTFYCQPKHFSMVTLSFGRPRNELSSESPCYSSWFKAGSFPQCHLHHTCTHTSRNSSSL